MKIPIDKQKCEECGMDNTQTVFTYDTDEDEITCSNCVEQREKKQAEMVATIGERVQSIQDMFTLQKSFEKLQKIVLSLDKRLSKVENAIK